MEGNLKLLHLLCACFFLGNVVVSGVWALMAERTRNHAVIKFSNRMVLITDVLFTFLGSAGLVWSGYQMSAKFSLTEAYAWIHWSNILISISGLIWLFVLVPIQLKQRKLLNASDSISEDYWKLSRIWQIAGACATLLVLPILYFMVRKSI
jgi:uncharacterized membrane protein